MTRIHRVPVTVFLVFAAISPACRLLLMAKKQNPIGFTKPKPMPREAEQYLTGNGEEEEDEKPEVPARQPKAAPVYVGTSETLEILAAYDLFPLTPLSNLEQQLVHVVAGLEQELAKHE